MTDWTVRGRASVMHFDVNVRVYDTRQLESAIKWLTENKYSFEYNVEHGDSATLDIFSITITSMCWANNLKEFAEILIPSDYNFEKENNNND